MLERFLYSRWIDQFRALINHDSHNAGSLVVIPAHAAGNPPAAPVPILDLRGDDPRAQVMSVAIEAVHTQTLPVGGGVGYSVRVWAEVLWGVGGTTHRAEVDVGTGTVLSIYASSLQVRVAQETVQAGAQPITVSARASVGFNPRGGPAHVTRTRYFDAAIAPAGAQDFLAPPYARAVSVYREQLAGVAQAYTLDFLDAEQAPAKTSGGVVVAAGADLPPHTPLANDVRAVRLTNAGAANINAVRVVFDLAF